MKPWEEKWEAGDIYDAVHIQYDEPDGDQLDMRYGRGDAMGRCQLAAAAPEMARFLLEIVHRMRHGSAGEVGDWLAEGDELFAVLRKAGVIAS